MARPVLTNADARRLFLNLHGLGPRPATLAALFDDLAFVQLDSISTVARAHHMIIHARLPAYRPRDLDRVRERRDVFEHWTHDASIIDMAHYPHWKLRFSRADAVLRERWGKWRPGFDEKIPEVLNRVARDGPLCSADVGDGEKRKSGGWWDWHPSKTALEYLWHTGQIAVCHRRGFRKYYDLAERVIPSDLLSQAPETPATIDWACNAALDRLGFATSGEIAAFFDLVSTAEARAWCASALAGGDIIEADIEGADGRLRRSFIRPEQLETARSAPPPSGAVRILSPFDPALRDRARAQRLFGFDYRIEVFVPAAKRKYGYYVFPVLEGLALIGRIDMKVVDGTLNVTKFWPEPGTAIGKGRKARLEAAIKRTSRLADADRIEWTGL